MRAAVGIAARLGGELIREGEREENGVIEAFAYVRDPDGYAIELSTQELIVGRIR